MFRGKHEKRMLLPAGAWRSKKALILAVLLVAALLAVTVVLVFAFWPSPHDTARAKDLMKSSDDTVQSTRLKGDEISRSVNMVLPNISYLTKAQYDVTAGNIRALTRDTRVDLETARQGYETILGLRGVDAYKEYAYVKLQLIGVDEEQLKLVDDYLDYLANALAGREAGTALNTQAIADTTSVSNQKLSELSSSMDELSKQAEEMKKEKEL